MAGIAQDRYGEGLITKADIECFRRGTGVAVLLGAGVEEADNGIGSDGQAAEHLGDGAVFVRTVHGDEVTADGTGGGKAVAGTVPGAPEAQGAILAGGTCVSAEPGVKSKV